jgi:hypothetical protein
LNLNPRQVQNVEDQYLAYQYNSGTGFHPSQSRANAQGNGQGLAQQQQSQYGQNGQNFNAQGTNGNINPYGSSSLQGLTESQLQRSSYNMALDKSRVPPLPNVHPNSNLGEYKMFEQTASVPSNTQSRNTYQNTAMASLSNNTPTPAPQAHRQPYPADNPMRFYK